jgi:hypothetical protein
VFDTSAQVVRLGGATLNANGSFSINTSGNVSITGQLSNNTIIATYNGQNISASLSPLFGACSNIAGRFDGAAVSANGMLSDVRFIVDSQGNIFFLANRDGTLIGGFGTAICQPGTRQGENDDEEDDDEENDDHEDNNAPTFNGSFSINLVSGGSITGTFNFGHDVFDAHFTLDGVIFEFRSLRESAANRFINISTRAFVTTGQGQLINGFIIRGGPKLVVIRVLGPSLATLGVSPVLNDPQVRLFHDNSPIAFNNNWQSNNNANDIIRSGFAPPNLREAVILIQLEPGNYTAVVTGADGGTGIALLEVYEINTD